MKDKIKEIRYKLQNSLEEYGEDYTLKTNDNLINEITIFGCGEKEFHTADIERLIKENWEYEKLIEKTEKTMIGKIDRLIIQFSNKTEEGIEMSTTAKTLRKLKQYFTILGADE